MTPTRARVFAVVVFSVLFGGEAVRNLLSWYGFTVIAVTLLVISVVVLVRHRRTGDHPSRRTWGPSVIALAAFLGWASLSVVWSDYRLATLLGIAAIGAATAAALAIRVLLPPRDLLRALVQALGILLVASLLFEIVVGAVVRGPILPVFPIDVVPGRPIPQAFYWSRGLLFEGGRIQGVLGNSNLLGFVALLAVITGFALWWGARRAARPRDALLGAGVGLAGLLTIALTRSATVTAALAITVLVVVISRAVRYARARGVRMPVLAAAVAAGSLTIAGVLVAGASSISTALGRSSDLTGRLDIWAAVWELIEQRPLWGWGWVGYWQPWIPIYHDLATRKGVVYLQAHNAFLDTQLQVGPVGVALLAAIIVLTFLRQRRAALGIALVTALTVQALAESRLLYEGNWALLVLLATGGLGALAHPPKADTGAPLPSRVRPS